ncbi:cell wall-binding repeat-containing protein [Euzebya rosea]|uniref:cell wall-binding repeat-containing protein n=1 Tax=Euzebya rosea TaxID=2052804 RepID=UPI000D3EB083|nr:cell wall-binding repeat-containing protein [Euzebya rosea]
MRITATLPRVRRATLLVVMALACVFASVPTAMAGQGAPPTTDLTGYVDRTPPPAQFAQGGCMPAGGSAIPDPELPGGEFVLVGGGWGHGAGMSQYGAQGAGLLGCTATQILTTYFPGTTIQAVPQPDLVVIGLGTGMPKATYTAERGTIPYRLCHYQSGECTDLPTSQPEGSTWRVDVTPEATYRITDTGNGAVVWEGGDKEWNLRTVLSPDPSVNRRVHVAEVGHTYRWGTLQLDSVLTGASEAYLTLEFTDMDLYLRGLAEVPISWPDATLQAQVISGRSYALARIQALGIRTDCRCHLYSTPRDQNYEGWDLESADSQGKWVNAVNATSGQILTHNGSIAETFYSSSHGGHSESSRFVFGGELPYVQPVDDSRWDLASSNPLRRWTAAFTADELGSRAGVGRATSMRLLEPRGAAGRIGSPSRGYGGVEVTGTTGTVVLSGDQLKSRLGLRSTLVDVRSQPGGGGPDPEPTPSPTPTPSPQPPPGEVPDSIARVAASDRIGTAVQVSAFGWDAASDVVIAASDRFPDALAGVALAASLEAPLLLSSTAELSPATEVEIRRLGATTAWLLGGNSALSTAVRGDLADMGLTTRRLAGDNRLETAAAIAGAAVGTADEVTLAPAGDWPDAVSASSLAALVDGPPTLLSGRDRVEDATIDALEDLGARTVTIIGGTAVIGPSVVSQLEGLGYEVRRLAGSNRFSTSTAVADEALAQRTGDVTLVIASASGFADALPAGALAARRSGVLVLAPRDSMADAPDVARFVESRVSRVADGVVVGGTGVISTTVETQLEQVLARR